MARKAVRPEVGHFPARFAARRTRQARPSLVLAVPGAGKEERDPGEHAEEQPREGEGNPDVVAEHPEIRNAVFRIGDFHRFREDRHVFPEEADEDFDVEGHSLVEERRAVEDLHDGGDGVDAEADHGVLDRRRKGDDAGPRVREGPALDAFARGGGVVFWAAADDGLGMPAGQFEEARDTGGVVLAVRIQLEHVGGAEGGRLPDARSDGRALAAVFLPHDENRVLGTPDGGFNQAPVFRVVPVIHDDGRDAERAELFEHAAQRRAVAVNGNGEAIRVHRAGPAPGKAK